MKTDIINLLNSININLELFTPIATALSSAYIIIFIGLKRLLRKKSKHEKYMIISSKEINTSDGKVTYILTENDHIRLLTDENEELKIKNEALSKQVTNARLVTVLVMMGALFLMWFHAKFSKSKISTHNELPKQ